LAEKQSEMKSPIRIQNYKRKLGFGGKDEIIIKKFIKLTPLPESDVGFAYNSLYLK
jgi:hypothetical protein